MCPLLQPCCSPPKVETVALNTQLWVLNRQSTKFPCFMHTISPRECLQRYDLGRVSILAHSGLYLTKRLTLKRQQVGVQPAKAAKRPMAEIHSLGSWPGATTPSADKFLLPRHDCPMTPSACSSRSHVTLGAGRRSRAAGSHVGDGPSVQAQAAVPIPRLSPQRVGAVQSAELGQASPVPQRSITCIISFIPASCSSFFPKGCSTFLLHLGEAELLLPFWSV